jgi:subtilase family serine protease/flagellar hook assembly protein FlgD
VASFLHIRTPSGPLLRGAAVAACCLWSTGASADSLSALDPLNGQDLRRFEAGIQTLAESGAAITRDVGSIAVIEHDGSNYDMRTSDGLPNYTARAPVARRFYQSHGDYYDFLVVFTNFPFQTGDAQAFHNLIRNDVRGIGRPIGDNGALFGSPGRLKGYIDMADLDRWRQPGGLYSLRPGDPGFQVTLNVLAHEVAHQWLAEARYQDASGRISADLLGKDGSHWSYLLDSDASVMYGSDWSRRDDGRYVASRTSATYSSLDLYLMGLLDPARLPAFTLLRNPSVDPRQTPELDAEMEGAPETVTVEQLVAAMGPRIPDHRASPKEFRLGFVFLTRPGTDPDPEDLAVVETLRQYFAAHFFALTRGVAVADTGLAETAAGEVAPVPDLDRALAWLLGQQTPEGTWPDSAATAIRDTATVLDALAAIGRTDAPYQHGVAWLSGVAPHPVDFRARRASSLAPTASSSPARAALLQAIVDAREPGGGFGFAPGFPSNALDTALALRALSRLGQPAGSTVRKAIAVLAAQQLPTGGWPVVAGGEASVAATAEVLLALQDWGVLPEAQALIPAALSALIARRNPDGGFGESPSTPYGTALALQALLRASAPAETVNAAVAWLQARQLSDGSWDASRYETALVLAALRGGLAANLVVPADGLSFAPESPVMEGAIVHVRARVRNVGRRPSDATEVRLYDGAPGPGAAVADATLPPLESGAETLAEFDLPTTDRPGDRTFYVVADPDGVVAEAREDDNAASRAFKVKGRLPDLVIAAGDLAVTPHPPEEGETVEVSMRVANRGARPSPPGLVRVVRGDPRAGGALLGQATLTALDAGQSVVVALPWDTTGQLGRHALHALADPVFAVVESNEANNEASLFVDVTGPRPPGPDLAVALVTFAPPVLQALPTSVEVRAIVHNLGRDLVESAVALHEGSSETPAGQQIVSLAPRSSTTVVFSLTVTTPGSRSFTVRADPAGMVTETDETNNERTAVLVDPRNTVDLEVRPQDVSTAPPDVVVGQTLVVTATIRNRGTSPVIDVPVVLRHASGELARTAVTLSAGTSTVVTLSWETTLSGDAVPLVVAADPFGLLSEMSEENNVVALAVPISQSPLANLQVSGEDIEFSPDPPREGEPAVVSALVRNTSPVTTGAFIVRFYRGRPGQGGVPLGEAALSGVAALSSGRVAFAWTRVDVRGAQGVFVVVDARDEIPEYNEEDNHASRLFSVLALPDLALTVGQVGLEPGYPRVGEPVSIRAVVHNFGQQASPETVVSALAGEPGSDAEIATAALPSIPPGGSALVVLPWTPDPPPGQKTLSVLVDSSGDIPETDEGNNRALLRILVQDPDLFLGEAHFSPDGDGVRDRTMLGYRVAIPVTVVVSNRAGRTVRTLVRDGPASGSLSWDGTDDRGRLLPDGPYLFTLESAQGAVLGRIQAFLDTNRESIHDAAGTGLVGIGNLTCNLPSRSVGPVFMPNEDEALFIVDFPLGDEPFPVGLLRAGLDGQYDFVSRDEWFQGGVSFASPRAVSPDGREVLVRRDVDLVAVDLLTGARRPIASGGHTAEALWSPDGRFIATLGQILTRNGDLVANLPQGVSLSHGAWSPDSQWIASANRIVRRDASVVRTIPGIKGQQAENGIAALDTVWRGDGMVVSYVGLDCGDGCLDSGVFVIDPDRDTATELAWLRAGPAQTSRSHIGWSADGARLLYSLDRDGPRGSFVSREDGSSPMPLLPDAVGLSPRSTLATYSAPAASGSGCLGFNDLFAAFSLQNLTVGLRPTRLPANNGILLNATVTDRHLSHYQLEYALSTEPDQWRPIGAASPVPILDDVLTVWVPPSAGTYLLRLRAEDRAGNQRSRTRIVAWDRVPLLANISQTETLISPNGDGRQDDVTFNYLVVEPTTAEVRIVGPHGEDAAGSGPLIRRFAREHRDVGPASFTWDGHDEAGVAAPDGRYTVFLNDLPFRVTVDTTPPDIDWAYENLRVEEGRLVADRRMRVVDPRLEGWSIPPWFGGRDQVYEPLRDEEGDVVFADGVPRMLIAGGLPVSRRVRAPETVVTPPHNELYNLATDDRATLAAADYAGNRSTLAILPVEERLALLRAGDQRGPFDENGIHKLPPHTAFVLAETIRGTPAGGESVRFQYRPRAGGEWTEAPPFTLDRETAWPADFASLGLSLGREYRGRFVTQGRDRSFVTQEFSFRPCTEAFDLDLDTVDVGQQRVVWALSLYADAPEPLASATLTVTGIGKLKGYRTVTPFAIGEDNYVTTPLPSCATEPPGTLVFEVRVTGQSGRVYDDDRQCRKLRLTSDLCSSLEIQQGFEYCDGSPDVLPLAVSATSVAKEATATIARGPGDPPDPIAELSVPFTPFLPYRKDLREDITGVPEGTVGLSGSLVNEEGREVAKAALAAVVDRTPPAVEVLEPPEHGVVCVTSDPANGRDVASLFLQVDDPGLQAEFAYAEVEHLAGALAGARTAMKTACAPLPPAALPRFPPQCGNVAADPAFPRLWTRQRAHLGWDVTGLPDGDYAVQAAFCDRAGNRTTARRRLSLVRQNAGPSLVSILPGIFSPNGDGAADEATIKLRMPQAARLTIEMKPGRTLLREAAVAAGEHSFTWDGRRDDGSLAPDGVYQVVVSAKDGCGREGAFSTQVVVDTTPPAVSIAAPVAGQTIGVATAIRGSADDAHLDAWELRFAPGTSAGEWSVAGGSPAFSRAVPSAVPPSLLARWDVPALSGTYTLRLAAYDLALNRAETQVAVEVRPRVYLGQISATPELFSPNGDGRRESTSLVYELVASGRATLDVITTTAVPATVRVLEPGIPRPPGLYTLSWDGTASDGSPVPEGEYRVRIRVEDPDAVTAPQEESIPVVVDRTPPAITVESPAAAGFAARDDAVRGTIADPILSRYVVTAFPATGTDPVTLAEGTRPPPGGTLASLAPLRDGRYTLFVRAEDAAENGATVDVPFDLDAIPPAVSITRPVAEGVLDSLGSRVDVAGTVTDENLVGYTLAFGPGEEPAYFTPIAGAEAGGVGIPLGGWVVTGVPDGRYTLRLAASDRAGMHGEVRRGVILDGTVPQASIDAPVEGAHVTSAEIVGSASDANLEGWTLESAPGAAADAYQWSPLAASTADVRDGSLARWEPLSPDGPHTLRLNVRDRAGHVSAVVRTVTVDRTPPVAPEGLAAIVERTDDPDAEVRLSWNPNQEPDLAGYRAYRDDVEIAGRMLTDVAYRDVDRPEGVYRYTVEAADRAGNVSPRATLRVPVDLTPPLVDILRPGAGALVSGSVEIRGTAMSADDFREYRLYVGASIDRETWTLLRRSVIPVAAGPLANWTAVGAGSRVLVLEAEDLSGNVARTTSPIVIDNDAPQPPVLVSLANGPDPTTLTVNWEASPSADVIGYLLYRDGRIANATALVLDALRSFLIPAPIYSDTDLPDGGHCYHVVAMDGAENLSPPSNQLCRTLDNRPPQAIIAEPPGETRFDHPLHIVAIARDTDIASIRFQYRAQDDGDAWRDVGSPDTSPPFEATLDPAPLAFGRYALRAVAADQGGRTDPDPAAIWITYGDATAPRRPDGLTARVDGRDVMLTWIAADEAAGYYVFRDGERLTTEAVPAASFVDAGRDTGLYRYEVTAVDADGNESGRSDPAHALVSKLVLALPPFPVTADERVSLGGSGAVVGATIEVWRGDDLVAQTSADSETFVVDAIPLDTGPNLLRARATDPDGNRSIPSDEVVVISNRPPPAVTNLAAAVNGYEVDLDWDPVNDPELHGYVVERGDKVIAGATAWLAPSGAGSPHWTVTFPTAVLVDRITLRFASVVGGELVPAPVGSYRIEVRWEGRFVPVVLAENNAASLAEHVLPTPFATDIVRVVIRSSEPQPGIADVEVSRIDVVPVGTTSRRDVPADGVFEYRVAAIDRYGMRGPAGVVSAAVGDVAAPSRPTGLVAVVDVTDVVLSWNDNPEPDVAHYIVVRDGLRVATTPGPAHRDVRRPNGTHEYRVIAVDRAGNQSPESDAAQATIGIAPPVAPLLQGTVGPLGEMFLTWDHPGAPDFVVYRGLTAGGPYGTLAHTGDRRSYEDRTAAFRVTHHYMVQALDASGNLSPPSNEIALTPLRDAPLPAPEILFPTDAAHPVTLERSRTTVQGRAPPDSLVLLDVNSTLAGITQTRPAWVERDAFAVPGYAVVVSRNGQTVVYQGSATGVEAFAVDVVTGQARQVVQTGYAAAFHPSPSPDGRAVAFVAIDDTQSSTRSDLFVMDLASGAVATVEDGAAQQVGPAVWSPDGTRLAYVTVAASSPYLSELSVRDLSTGTTDVVAVHDLPLQSVAWSADGSRLAFSIAEPEVRIVDLASGAESAIVTGTQPSWSPDGRRLAYTKTTATTSQIVVRNLDSGQEVHVTDGTGRPSHPAFDGTGTRLGYVEWKTLAWDDVRRVMVVHELDTGRRHAIETRPGAASELAQEPGRWLDDGRLAVGFDWEPRLAIFEPEEGFFELSDIGVGAGENTLVARALEVASGVVSPDSEPVYVTAPESLFPDLAVAASDVTVHPVAPVMGEPALVSAIVRALAEPTASAVSVRITVLDAAGEVALDQRATVPVAAPGGTTVSASWTPLSAGTHRFLVRVDPEGAIDELREDNNEAVGSFEVAPRRELVARLVSDRDVYTGRSPVRLDVLLLNAGAATAGQVRVTVEDTAGREVAVLDGREVALAHGAENRFTLLWNTGATYAGDYAFRLQFAEAREEVLATAQRSFRITADISVGARLQADRALFGEGSPATFTARVENTGLNAALADLVARFSVVPEHGTAVLLEADKPVGLLLPGGLWQAPFAWPSALPSGRYRATLTVVRQGQTLATSVAPFQVSPSVTSFGGALTLQPGDALAGERVDARLSVSNRGVTAVSSLVVVVEVRDGAEATVLRRETLTLDLMPGETSWADVSLTTPPAGTYPVLLRVGEPAATLARATLRVHGPITPPSVDAPAAGARVTTSHPELRVNNAVSPEGAPLVYEFQLFADGVMRVVLPGTSGVPETPGATSWRVASKLAEDGTYWWRARATDGFSSSGWTALSSFEVDERNEPPAAPGPDRPEPGERVASREPTLVVTNALDPELDPLTYEFHLAMDPDLSAAVASASGVEQGPAFTSWRVPAPLEENETYYWSARAFDGIGHSPWAGTASFIVDTVDEAPTAPVPLRPVGGGQVSVLAPPLVLGNAIDPEGRPLTYQYEIDVVPTFDSPEIQVSAAEPETAVETAWTPPAALRDDTAYYWRAAASDGRTASPWAGAEFFVSLANDAPAAPVPWEPADFQVVTTVTPTLRVRNAVDPERDPLTYGFEVMDQAGMVVATQVGVPAGASDTSWTVPTSLAENGLFLWRARASDAVADGPWSVASHFRVNAVAESPTAPRLMAPPEASVIDTSRVTLVVFNATSPDGWALTYTFEIYAVSAGGSATLVASTTGVTEGQPHTSWAPLVDLPDGSYSWRAQASDGHLAGPWMASGHFRVTTDVAPAPPAGLAAVPGDGEVTLTWNANPEPDVTGYRVYRSEASGGPYALVAAVGVPGLVDRGRTNGVTIHYVATAFDVAFESGYSSEVAATPRARDVVAEVRYRPNPVAGECLVPDDDDDGDHDDDDDHHRGEAGPHGGGSDHDDDDGDHEDDDDGHPGDGERCPRWIYATAELPAGHGPGTIDRATVRLAGAVRPDPGYDRIVDVDRDGLRERELRFRFDRLAPHVHVGANALTLTGRAGGLPFQGTGTLTVLALDVELWLTPRTLKRRSPGQSVQAQLTFASGIRAAKVDKASLRLNDVLPIARVVATQDTRLIVKFDREAVASLLPGGDQVPVWVSGTINGVAFVARDVIRVID